MTLSLEWELPGSKTVLSMWTPWRAPWLIDRLESGIFKCCRTFLCIMMWSWSVPTILLSLGLTRIPGLSPEVEIWQSTRLTDWQERGKSNNSILKFSLCHRWIRSKENLEGSYIPKDKNLFMEGSEWCFAGGWFDKKQRDEGGWKISVMRFRGGVDSTCSLSMCRSKTCVVNIRHPATAIRASGR